MGFSHGSILLKIGFILIIVTLVIDILATALPYWYDVDTSNSASAYGGLFKACAENGGTKACANFDEPAEWLAACQAFAILSILVMVVALILCIIVLFIKNEMKILKLVTWILCFVACGFMFITVAIYGGEAPGIMDEYSGAFGIKIVAGILALIAGVLVLLDWMKKGSAVA